MDGMSGNKQGWNDDGGKDVEVEDDDAKKKMKGKSKDASDDDTDDDEHNHDYNGNNEGDIGIYNVYGIYEYMVSMSIVLNATGWEQIPLRSILHAFITVLSKLTSI